jgi:uncharacterized protein YjiS (DUF1127 family)
MTRADFGLISAETLKYLKNQARAVEPFRLLPRPSITAAKAAFERRNETMILTFLIHAIRTRMKARATRNALMTLDDRTLADIGLMRSQIKAVAFETAR